jgi:hypothetical protein
MNSKKEVWNDIPNFNGLYQASNKGRIKSIGGRTSGFRLTKEIIRKQNVSNGYSRVSLYKNNKCYCKFVHRIVLESFYGESNLHCNHIDGNKKNNNIENLEYCTRSQNMQHAYKNGLINNKKGEEHPCHKLTEGDVIRIRFLKGKVEFGYWKKLSSALNVSRETIYGVTSGRSWNC